MTIKYLKCYLFNHTLPKVGEIEVYSQSKDHISPEELAIYEGLKVRISLTPELRDFWYFKDYAGAYLKNTQTCWVKTNDNSVYFRHRIIRHELLHACQHTSEQAKQEVYSIASSFENKFYESKLMVKRSYSEASWDMEIPVWTLHYDAETCKYLINKYLK